MRNIPDAVQESETIVASHSLGGTKLRLVLGVMILFSICTLTLLSGRGASAVTNEPTGRQLDFLNTDRFTLAPDYSKFSHSSPREHADLMGRLELCVLSPS